MIEYENGCCEEETLKLYSRFHDNPHVHTIEMFVEEEFEIECVSVGFLHYSEDFMVHFNVETQVGEVWIAGEGEDMFGYSPYGMITVEKLGELLEELPHIKGFMENNVSQTLH